MKYFLIGLAVLVVIIIVYFIYADYKSRKETDKIVQQSAPTYQNGRKKPSAMDWITSLLPVVAGTIDTILSKPKPEEEEDVDEIAPSYEDLINQGNLDYPAYG